MVGSLLHSWDLNLPKAIIHIHLYQPAYWDATGRTAQILLYHLRWQLVRSIQEPTHKPGFNTAALESQGAVWKTRVTHPHHTREVSRPPPAKHHQEQPASVHQTLTKALPYGRQTHRL